MRASVKVSSFCSLIHSMINKQKGWLSSHPLIFRVARGGFEPPLTGPKPAVLPLDDRAIHVIDRLQR